MTICGMGWTGMSYDYDEDPEGMVQTPCIDPILKYWDPASKEPNLADRRYDFTLVKMDVEHFKFLFPKTNIQPSLRTNGRTMLRLKHALIIMRAAMTQPRVFSPAMG